MKRVLPSKRSKLRLLLYGKPGSCKTTLAGTAGLDPRSAPVLWIDAGGNPISLAHLRQPAIDVLQIDTIGDLQEIYKWLAAGQPERDPFPKINQLKPGYKTVVIDGITHTQRLSFDAITGAANLMPGAMPPLEQWPHFRQVLGQMILIASKFYTLDMHVIITALEHNDIRPIAIGEKEVYVYREPALAGASVDQFPGWAFNVGRMAQASTFDPTILKSIKGEGAYSVVQFRPSRYVDAKDQHRLGDYIADPTIAKFLDIIDRKPEGGINAAAEAAPT